MITTSLPYIENVQVHENYQLTIQFTDGLVKRIDILPFIKNGVSRELRDADYFKKVSVENGYITWPNGFDFCPEFLRNYVV